MSKRLTIDVAEVLRLTNARMVSHGFAPEAQEKQRRYGLASLCEQILHATGNYAGYGYIGAEGLPSPTPEEIRAGNYDDSRRVYFYSPKLQRAKAREIP